MTSTARMWNAVTVYNLLAWEGGQTWPEHEDKCPWQQDLGRRRKGKKELEVCESE